MEGRSGGRQKEEKGREGALTIGSVLFLQSLGYVIRQDFCGFGNYNSQMIKAFVSERVCFICLNIHGA